MWGLFGDREETAGPEDPPGELPVLDRPREHDAPDEEGYRRERALARRSKGARHPRRELGREVTEVGLEGLLREGARPADVGREGWHRAALGHRVSVRAAQVAAYDLPEPRQLPLPLEPPEKPLAHPTKGERQGLREEYLLRVEVRVEPARCEPRRLHDRVDSDSRESALLEQTARLLHDPGVRALLVVSRVTHPCLYYDRHIKESEFFLSATLGSDSPDASALAPGGFWPEV